MSRNRYRPRTDLVVVERRHQPPAHAHQQQRHRPHYRQILVREVVREVCRPLEVKHTVTSTRLTGDLAAAYYLLSLLKR